MKARSPLMRDEHIKVIHVAKRKLGLSEERYRQILRRVGNVESSRDLDRYGFSAVMYVFHELGFKSDFSQRNLGYRSPNMPSLNQIALIRQLWSDVTDGQGTEAGLNKWIRGRFKVAGLTMVNAQLAQKVIGGLTNWKERRAQRQAEPAMPHYPST